MLRVAPRVFLGLVVPVAPTYYVEMKLVGLVILPEKPNDARRRRSAWAQK